MAKKEPKTIIISAGPSPIQRFEAMQGELLSELSTFEEEVVPFAVDNQEDLALLAEVLAKSKGHEKKTTALMKEALAPIDEQRIGVQSIFKPVIDRLKSIEKVIKQKVGEYDQRQRQRQFLALEAAAKANMGGNAVKAEQALARADRLTVEPIKGMSIRYSIDIEIENEDLIPDEYWVVDEARIGKYARATNGEVPIPGVIYHRTPIVASKAR